MPADNTTTKANSVRTKGEVKVWLTAAGLTVGLLMIVSLLMLIGANGLAVFWPDKVLEFTVTETDGKTVRVAGALLREQERITGPHTTATEFQIFTGNKDAYGLAYRFVSKSQITATTTPADIYVAERMEYGDALFYPLELQLKDGRKIAAAATEFPAEFARLVREGNDRRAAILKIEKGRIGEINARMRTLELQVRETVGEAGGAAALNAQIEAQRGLYQVLANQAQKLRAEQGGNKLLYRLASGEERTQNLGDIVHYYQSNRLSWSGKAAVFGHQVWDFLSSEPREANTEGGIFPAIFGTFVMTLLMAVMVTPFGIIAAIYLREYAHQGMTVRIVRICVNNLAGVPSIVFGVFGLGFFVYGIGGFIDGGVQHPMPAPWWFIVCVTAIVCVVAAVYLLTHNRAAIPTQRKRQRFLRKLEGMLWVSSVLLVIVAIARCPYFHGFFRSSLPAPTFGTGGILWASLTLALMTLPVVIVATEEALVGVPRGVREAALACGASKWQTIQRIVLPSALPGVMTGVILAMARGAGEVAPLMITGVVKLAPSLPLDFTAPFIHAERKFMHLGFHIYDLGFQSPDSEGAKPMVFATTLLLILLVIALNITAIHVRTKLRKRFQASAF